MKNNKLISEAVDVKAEVITVTSDAGSTSRQYDMRGYDSALLVADISGNYTTVTIDLMESSAATAAGTSAAGSKAGMILGGAATLISTSGGVQRLTLTMTSVTDGSFTLNTGTVTKKFTFSTSTALHNSSAWASTNLYFGSTVDSTADTGAKLAIDALKTAIVSTLAFGPDALVLSTGSTASITIQAGPAAVGNLGFQTTDANLFSAVVNEACGAFNINADQLASTANKRYVSLKISSAATSCPSAISVVRACGHIMPPVFSGKLST